MNMKFAPLSVLAFVLLSACHGQNPQPAAAPPGSYPLALEKRGSGSGVIVSNPAGIECGSVCAADFSPGAQVRLTAVAASDSAFVGWNGAGCGGTGACTVSMDGARAVLGVFNLKPRFTVNINKSGLGTVRSDIGDIDCGSQCAREYVQGEQVVLSATPADDDQVFSGWGGACGGSGACGFTVNADTLVTAHFITRAPVRGLSVSVTGDGAGRVTSTPAGIDCTSNCSASYDKNQVVQLSAAPSAGSRFAGWSGACTGTAACSVTLNTDKSVGAVFTTLPLFALDVSKTGQGSIISNPVGIHCGDDCTENFTQGTTVGLSAQQASGFRFASWGGACSGSEACVVTMDAAREVSALFNAVPRFALMVVKSGVGFGSVTSAPAGIDCGSTCGAEFDEGTLVTLNAVELAGSRFDGWSGVCTGQGACSVTMDAAKSVTALFSLAPLAGDVLMAGAAKLPINPTPGDLTNTNTPEGEKDSEGLPQFFNLGGFGTKQLEACGPGPFSEQCFEALGKEQEAQGIKIDNYVRAFVLKRGNTEVAFVNIDAIGAGNIIITNIKNAVNTATGIPQENVIVGLTHSHSAADLQGLWGGVPTRWRTELYAKAAATVKQAHDALTPVKLFAASGQINFNNYRRPKGDDVNSATAKFVTDKQLSVIQARSLVGTVIGTMSQYSAHPTVLGTSNRFTHPDYVATIHDTYEQAYGGTSVYFNGVICDASPRTPEPVGNFPGVERDYERARLMGIGVANKGIEFITNSKVEIPDTQALFVRHTNVVLPITNPLFLAIAGKSWFNGYYDFDQPGHQASVNTLVSRVRIGEATGNNRVEIVSVPGEATGPFGKMIRTLSGAPHTMLLGLTQNSLGYIIPSDEFGRTNENDHTNYAQTAPANCVSSAGEDCREPETPYEETVSLGPATAPELENLGYRVLFNDQLPTTPAPP